MKIILTTGVEIYLKTSIDLFKEILSTSRQYNIPYIDISEVQKYYIGQNGVGNLGEGNEKYLMINQIVMFTEKVDDKFL